MYAVYTCVPMNVILHTYIHITSVLQSYVRGSATVLSNRISLHKLYVCRCNPEGHASLAHKRCSLLVFHRQTDRQTDGHMGQVHHRTCQAIVTQHPSSIHDRPSQYSVCRVVYRVCIRVASQSTTDRDMVHPFTHMSLVESCTKVQLVFEIAYLW